MNIIICRFFWTVRNRVKVEYQGHRSRSDQGQNSKNSNFQYLFSLNRFDLVFSQGHLFKVMVKYEGHRVKVNAKVLLSFED